MVINAYKYAASVMPKDFRDYILIKGYHVASWYNMQKQYTNNVALEEYSKELTNILSKTTYDFTTITKENKHLLGIICIKTNNKKTRVTLFGIEIFKRKTSQHYTRYYFLGICYKKEKNDAYSI